MYTIDNLPTLLHEVKKKLRTNQNLMKCLKYETSDALSQADLTNREISELFREDEKDKCRVLSIPFPVTTTKGERAELRIFVNYIDPNNLYLTSVNINIQVICSKSLWQMENGVQRPLQMVLEILKILNGKQVKGVGQLVFKNKIQIQLYNDKFAGFIMSPTIRTC